MTDQPRVSVVIASHGRPEALLLCLKALQFQTYRPFEVIVVACEKGLSALEDTPFRDRIKLIAQGDSGLSVARNDGIASASSEIIAFIDDDAVADPPWLSHLVRALDDTGAAGVGGWVRASNGISFEWTGGALSTDLQNDHGGPTVMGTNMAFRAKALRQLNGFDPAFRYYLDEADLTARMAERGMDVVNAPLAQVHHGAAPNALRGRSRVPRALARIGESEALYLRRHADPDVLHAALARLRRAQRRRLLRMMIGGKLGPERVLRLMADYDRGVAEGLAQSLTPLAPLTITETGFLPFLTMPPKKPEFMGGRSWHRKSHLAKARDKAATGVPVSLFLFSPSMLFHRRRFTADGVWVQAGGLFGKSGRAHPLAQRHDLKGRFNAEVTRVCDSFML